MDLPENVETHGLKAKAAKLTLIIPSWPESHDLSIHCILPGKLPGKMYDTTALHCHMRGSTFCCKETKMHVPNKNSVEHVIQLRILGCGKVTLLLQAISCVFISYCYHQASAKSMSASCFLSFFVAFSLQQFLELFVAFSI